MCPPKAPSKAEIAASQPPNRMAAVLPDGGDPVVRASLKNARKLAQSSMIFTNAAGTLGMPSVAGGG